MDPTSPKSQGQIPGHCAEVNRNIKTGLHSKCIGEAESFTVGRKEAKQERKESFPKVPSSITHVKSNFTRDPNLKIEDIVPPLQSLCLNNSESNFPMGQRRQALGESVDEKIRKGLAGQTLENLIYHNHTF